MATPTFPVGGCRIAALACVIALAACGGSSPPPPPPLRLSVDGVIREVAPGTTLKGLGLHAHDGRLLSVSGNVLDPLADPGRIVVNGHVAPPRSPLHDGDAIRVLDGETRTEGTRRIVAELPGRHVGNPEFSLRTYRIRQVTVEGRLSGEPVSFIEIPRGTGRAPKAVALTFDDGPWPNATDRVLAILRRLHVRATFFMVGRQVEEYPEIARRVVAAGHVIGDHSFDHPEGFASLSDERVGAEIADTAARLADLGVVPTSFRPPGGSYDDGVVAAARSQGMRTVLWDVDPRDWVSGVPAKLIVSSVLRRVEPGSIILLHDGGGDAQHTIKALPILIRELRRRGYRFVAIPGPNG
ncbi:MAG: polysaccharide deacetylase family protein [Actinomycetota bacterium]